MAPAAEEPSAAVTSTAGYRPATAPTTGIRPEPAQDGASVPSRAPRAASIARFPPAESPNIPTRDGSSPRAGPAAVIQVRVQPTSRTWESQVWTSSVASR